MDRPTSERSTRGPDGDARTNSAGSGRVRRGERSSTPIARRWTPTWLRMRVASLVSGVRFGQFLAVGVLGAALDNAALVGLYEFTAVPLAPAKLASAELAILFMFVLNERWTFAAWSGADPHDVLRRVVTSNLVRFGGVLVATGVLLALAELGVWYVLANLVGIGVGAVVNYAAESLFTWRVHRG